MAEKRGKILVIRGGAIGDFILTLPAIAALRATFPETHLEVLGYPVVAELALAAGMIDAFRSIEARPLARFFARNAELDPAWSNYFESFHLVVSYLYDPDDIFKTNIGRTTRAQFIQGPHRPGESGNIHATAVFLKPLEQLAIFEADPVPRLSIPIGNKLDPGKWLAAHPGSGGERKNWPEENWLALLRSLLETDDFRVLLVGGEAEGERLSRLSGALPAEKIRIARNLPLVELASWLEQCAFFIGHDSGITHLAAALGLPVLALWGPSNEAVWRPLNPRTRLIKGGAGLESISTEKVRLAINDLLKSGS